MEVSSHALSLGRVDGVRFAAGGFTNLSRDHLDFHPTMADYFEAKARLFDPASPSHARVRGDLRRRRCGPRDGRTRRRPRHRQHDTRRRLDRGRGDGPPRRVARNSPPSIRPVCTTSSASACRAATTWPIVLWHWRFWIPSGSPRNRPHRGCVMRGCPAGWSRSTAVRTSWRWSTTRTSRGRCGPCSRPCAVPRTANRIAVVFGAGGNRDPGKRAPMGATAAGLADLVVVTDDNPRDEDPAEIRAAILAGAAGASAEVVEIGDRRAAIAHAVAWAQPGDVVLIAGKGHEIRSDGARADPAVRRSHRTRRRTRGTRVIDLTVAQIAEIVGGELADISAADAARLHITGTVEFDSRAVTPGGLFLALPGARADGHDHAAAAVAAGAVAVLAARPVGVPAIVVRPDAPGDRSASVLEHDRDGSGAAVLAALARLAAAVAARLVEGGLTIVGVTGSSGKTSTKDLLAAVLSPLGEVIAPPGSFNNELGHPWTVLRATGETDYLVLEMSARHPGNIAALAAIAPPQIAVVLNVGTAHLGEFGSRQAIADTKAELPQAVPSSGVVVLNVDDSAVAAMADKTAARVVRVSRSRPTAESTMPPRNEGEEERGSRVDVWAENVVLDDLARAELHAPSRQRGRPGATGRVRRPPGIQRAVRGRRRAGMRGAPANRSPRRWPRPGRPHPVGWTSSPAATASPSSTTPTTPTPIRCAPACRRWPGWPDPGTGSANRRRSWAVLGEMAELGDDAISEHDRIGRLAVRLDVSRLVVVGTGRSMSAMHQGAVMEGSWGAEATRVDDADAALALLCAELRPGDVVLVKASNSAGLAALAQALIDEANGAAADETDPDRRRPVAGGVDPADAAADPAVHPAGLRPRDPRGRPAQPQDQAWHPVDGRCGDPGRHLGRVSGHAPDRGGPRRRRAVGVGPAGTGPGHRARLGRLHRRPDQDPPVAQPRPEQDRQDRRADHRRGAVRRAGAGLPQQPTDSHRAARNCPTCARSPRSP